MSKRILGRMKETKITDMEVNWLYSSLIAGQPIDPTHLMINRWCCEATSGSGDIGSGCYLSMLAISLRLGIPRNPEHLLVRTSPGFDYLKQGKYISGFCRMDLPGPTTSVGTRTDYSVGPWDYPTCAARYQMVWSTRTTEEKYSVRKLYMSRTVWKTPRRPQLVLSPYSDL
jgi:hypothetical protein